MKRNIHVFDNGVKVYDDQLVTFQRDRYAKRNVHEAEEEDIFIEILQAIPIEGCFVNIGSAIGYYPLLAKKLAPGLNIHAIEPLERHRVFFVENIALNGLKQSSFTVHTEGISSADGEAQFLDLGYSSLIQSGYESERPKGLRSIVRSLWKALLTRKSPRRVDTTQTIRTKTLDNLCKEIGRVVDFCQMDVQGLELHVLRGAPRALQTGNVKTFLIGTHSQELHEDCINVLVENYYVIEYDNYNTTEQPDGILVASKGCQRLGFLKNKH